MERGPQTEEQSEGDSKDKKPSLGPDSWSVSDQGLVNGMDP
jgi:hypothetical protein